MSADALRAGVAVPRRDARRVPRRPRRSARRQRRRERRALRGAPVRDGRRRLRARRDRRRDRADVRPWCAPAFDQGAIGFTSSQLELHVAHDGRGVPSNHARARGAHRVGGRCCARSAAARSSSSRARSSTATTTPTASSCWRWRGRRAGPCTSTRSRCSRTRPRAGRAVSSSRRSAPDAGLDVHPMFATNRQGAHFSLDSTFLFDEMPSFRDTLTLPEPGSIAAPARPGGARPDAQGDRRPERSFVRVRVAGRGGRDRAPPRARSR